MIDVNKNTLAGAFVALGKMICRTSPLEYHRMKDAVQMVPGTGLEPVERRF